MRATRERTIVGLLTLCGIVGGCNTDPPLATSPTGGIVSKNSAPAGSPLARVSLGMTKDQVANAIGDATESRGHLTNKNFNPLYFGKDRYRTIWSYAGQGRLTFDMNATLILIEYDPSEPGHAAP